MAVITNKITWARITSYNVCYTKLLRYRRTWGDLQTIGLQLGFPLLSTIRGGRDGGGSALSPQGKLLVEAFDRFHQRTDQVVNEALAAFLDEVKSIRSED